MSSMMPRPDSTPEEAPASRAANFDSERLELAVEATELGLWEWDIRTGAVAWSERQREIFGLKPGDPVGYDAWAAALHPEDRERIIAEVGAAINPAGTGRLRFEHRIVRPDGRVRWILANARALFEGEGPERRAVRLLGSVLDITERKEAEEERQILVRELNHRVKNLFAVATSLVALTARQAGDPKAMGAALRGRFEALGRAHELLQPQMRSGAFVEATTALDSLARAVLAPYADPDRARIALGGPEIRIGAQAATSLTLVLHELATNAAKYGALKVAEGTLSLVWTLQDDILALTWRERGGPPLAGPPGQEGFGSKLARRSIAGPLGGTIDTDWAAEGLSALMRVPVEKLMR